MQTESAARKPRVNDIDRHIGARVRIRRTLMGIGQEVLAAKLGLTFQQVQKYEKGANRVSGSRIVQMARALDVPPSFFFDDMGIEPASAQPTDSADHRQLMKRETLELVRAYYSIEDDQLRTTIYEMVKAAGGTRRTRTRAAA